MSVGHTLSDTISVDTPSVCAKGTRISLKINQVGYSSPIGLLRVRGQLQMKLLS